jgi:hypothetical protein
VLFSAQSDRRNHSILTLNFCLEGHGHRSSAIMAAFCCRHARRHVDYTKLASQTWTPGCVPPVGCRPRPEIGWSVLAFLQPLRHSPATQSESPLHINPSFLDSCFPRLNPHFAFTRIVFHPEPWQSKTPQQLIRVRGLFAFPESLCAVPCDTLWRSDVRRNHPTMEPAMVSYVSYRNLPNDRSCASSCCVEKRAGSPALDVP